MTDTAEQPTLDDVAHADDRVDPITGDTIDATGAVVPPLPAVPDQSGQTMEPNKRELEGDVPAMWVAAIRLAARIHATPFVPGTMRGKPNDVLACILYGDELGIGPMRALAQIQVIDGKPGASPELMRALVQRAGHKFEILEKSNERVVIRGTRGDTGAETTVTFTLEDAVTAELCTIKDGKAYQRTSSGKKGSWEKYPRAMLMARATSELCRDQFSDVIAGLSYTPEELSDIAAGDGRTVDPDTGEITE